MVSKVHMHNWVHRKVLISVLDRVYSRVLIRVNNRVLIRVNR